MKNYNKMEYLCGKEKDFFDYLSKINKKDKIAVITHIDLDGIASAILINEILRQKKIKISSLSLINYGKGMFEKAEQDFKKGTNQIFILDVNAEADLEGFNNLKKKYNSLVIDHHPSELFEENMIRTKTEDCATFALFEIAKKEFDLSKWEWLVCSTMIAEFSYNNPKNLEFIKKYYPEISKENILVSESAKISNKISSALIYFKNEKRKVFDYILKGKLKKLNKYSEIIEKGIQEGINKFKKEAEFFPDKNLYFYYLTPKFSIGSIITTILSIKEPKKSFVFVSDVEGEPEYIKASSRNQSGKEDMNLLMKKGIKGLENATGGGHVPAAAAKFMKKDLNKFKTNLLS